jgi:hypothetical protein
MLGDWEDRKPKNIFDRIKSNSTYRIDRMNEERAHGARRRVHGRSTKEA